MILIDAADLRASRPNRPLFTDLSLTLRAGDRIGLVGINGCGKSTLLRILSGDLEPEAGVVRRGRGARIGALAQIPVLTPGTVRSVVGDGLDGREWRGEAMLDRLGMSGVLDTPTDGLSGGQRKRVALAALLARDWDALILDEPTNHLDLDAIAFLESWLAEFAGGLLLVTHDRHVLDRVTTKVLEIDRGASYLHVPQQRSAGSGYAAYLAARIEREEQAAAAEQTRKNLARRELAWLRRGAPARTSKPKARVDAARALISRGPQAAARPGEIGLTLGSSRLGSRGVELHDVSFSWPGESRRVLDHVVHSFEPGDRVGVVGPNGAGKSTLLDLIAGRLHPTAGTIVVGTTVQVGYYDQLGRALDPTQRVRDAVAGEKGAPSVADGKLMRQFWFDDDTQMAPIGTLSGGERRRLQLLLTLVEQPNVLLLDEPTNDLDLDTLRALEEFLDDWPGIVLVVSHDRVFLDRTVNEVLALDGHGHVTEVAGGVAGWLRSRSNPPTPSQPVTAAKSPVGTSTSDRRTTKKSPSTLRHQLGVAERELTTATATRDELQHQLATAGRDHETLARLGTELGEAQTAVDRAEERWLLLADQAESLGMDL